MLVASPFEKAFYYQVNHIDWLRQNLLGVLSKYGLGSSTIERPDLVGLDGSQ